MLKIYNSIWLKDNIFLTMCWHHGNIEHIYLQKKIMKKIYTVFLLLVAVKINAQTNPANFDLSGGDYNFTAWAATAPAGTYPANIIFQYTTDPSIPAYDPFANGTVDYTCAYNLTGRNRINGQGANGVSFVATSTAQYDNCTSGTASNTRFVGAAVLGINSTGRTALKVTYTGRTISQSTGDRIFALRLQYRVGTVGAWTDVAGGQYTSGAAATNNTLSNIPLPAACENIPNLFLRWIYLQVAGSTSTRPELALDDVTVGSATVPNNLELAFSSSNTSTAPPYVSGTINDATDPAANNGVMVSVKDNGADINAADYTLTASTGNGIVVPNSNIAITKANGSAVVKISPAGVGYSDITLTLTKGNFIKTLVINYAASQSSSANTKWLSGFADASAAIALDDNNMIIADDESNFLYVYNRANSGQPLKKYDVNQANILGLTDGSAGAYKEVDIEAGIRSIATPNKLYWIGSMSNSSSFNDKPNRNKLFAVTVAGTGAATTFADAGHISTLRQDLIAWGNTYGYDFTASAAVGKDPKLIDGFNIEGMVFAPDNSTMYIGFRAPLVPMTNRTKAVIAHILDFENWFAANSFTAAASIGAPIELDLGGRGIRDMIKLANGVYIIVAGNYAGTPKNGMIYKWSGNAGDAPVAIPSFNITNIDAEAALPVYEGGILSLNKLQIINDDGTAVFYGDGVQAKDLAQAALKKFASEIIVSATGTVLPVEFEYVKLSGTGKDISLMWKMAHMEAIQYFEVQQSLSGSNFSSIAAVPVATGELAYNFTERQHATKMFYRVRAVKTGGQQLFSSIRFIEPGNNYAIKIYPNPVVNNLFTISTGTIGIKHLSLFNVAGGLVQTIRFTENQKDISVEGYAKGMYNYILTDANGATSKGLVIIQ